MQNKSNSRERSARHVWLLALVILGFSLVLTVTSCGQDKAASEPIKIGAIFDYTGPIAFLGDPEEKTARMLAEKINLAGGINGRKIELIIKDAQASPEKAIAFANQLIEEEKVLAIIGPTSSGTSLAIKEICEEGKTLLLSCAAAEAISEPVASFVFTTPQQDRYACELILKTMNDLGIKKIGLVAEGTGFGNGGKEQFAKYAPQYGIEVVIAESYSVKDTDFTALLNKVKGTGVQALVNWAVFPAQSIIPKNMKQIGFNVPLFHSHGFGNIKYVETIGEEASEGILFPCGKLLAVAELTDTDPQKKLLAGYKKDYEATYQEAVSTFGGHAYDAFMILLTAIKAVGTDQEKVRAYIENLTNHPGTAGIYNYSVTNHNGLGIDSLVMYQVKKGKFTLYKP